MAHALLPPKPSTAPQFLKQPIYTILSPQTSNLFPSPHSQPLASYFTENRSIRRDFPQAPRFSLCSQPILNTVATVNLSESLGKPKSNHIIVLKILQKLFFLAPHGLSLSPFSSLTSPPITRPYNLPPTPGHYWESKQTLLIISTRDTKKTLDHTLTNPQSFYSSQILKPARHAATPVSSHLLTTQVSSFLWVSESSSSVKSFLSTQPKIPTLTLAHAHFLSPCFHLSCSVQSLSRVQLFANPMDCRTPGLPVHHQLLELAQTHVY